MSASFDRLASVTASTKRPPAMVDGKRGAPVVYIASLACTPLDPTGQGVGRLAERVILETPHEVLQTFVQGGLDIREGDVLVVSGTEYPIRAVEDWYWRPDGANYLRLYVEDLKT